MMDFIMAPAICGIFVLGFYKLFELFVCRKERLSIIEKMGDKFTPDMLTSPSRSPILPLPLKSLNTTSSPT